MNPIPQYLLPDNSAVVDGRLRIGGVDVLGLADEYGTPLFVYDEEQMRARCREAVSAFGTVGLSTGLTPSLSVFGQLWIIVTMFVGRLGPLTLALWMFTRKAPGVRYPEGRIMIG